MKIITGREFRIDGIQLTGRHAWPDSLSNAARAYSREPDAAKQASLKAEQRKAAEEIAALQRRLGFSYITDGGFLLKDDFIPYIEKLKGVEGGKGQISKQPVTRNQYNFISFVKDHLSAPDEHILGEYLQTDAIPGSEKKKLILLSPLSFALGSDNSSYSSLADLLADFAEIQGNVIRSLSGKYDYIQLTESFVTDWRSDKKVSKDLLAVFTDSLNRTFKGVPVRSCVFVTSGDSKTFRSADLLPWILESSVTDIGLDFDANFGSIKSTIDKNLLLGLQDIHGKLSEKLLLEEPKNLVTGARHVLASLSIQDSVQVFLGQSYGSDGQQTFPQAVRRDENLSEAQKLIRGALR